MGDFQTVSHAIFCQFKQRRAPCKWLAYIAYMSFYAPYSGRWVEHWTPNSLQIYKQAYICTFCTSVCGTVGRTLLTSIIMAMPVLSVKSKKYSNKKKRDFPLLFFSWAHSQVRLRLRLRPDCFIIKMHILVCMNINANFSSYYSCYLLKLKSNS